MTTVEPIRNLKDIKKVENILMKQNMRNALFFTIGTNCGLRISDIVALDVKDVSVLGRSTQGVTLMRSNDGGKVVSIAKVSREDKDEAEE